MRRTSVNLNVALVDKARKELGTTTIKETIEAALWETIAMFGREAFLERERNEPYDAAAVERWEEERRKMWNRALPDEGKWAYPEEASRPAKHAS